MKRILTALSLVIILVLTGCTSNNYSKPFTFTGESDNWSVELKVTQGEDDYEKQDFTLQYKEQDVTSVGEIIYTVTTKASSFSANGATLNENGIYTDTSESNVSNAKVTDKSKVNVTVEWNNQTESISLKNK
ncbi:hypothetical protein NDK25_19925 [Niallia taxi]|nr:hypothetical protein [Niallia taxi]MDE5054506.1 hypothetical protein [Niallia taxi]